MARTNAPTPKEAREIEAVLRRRNETFADAWALNLNLALRISDLLALTFDDVAGCHKTPPHEASHSSMERGGSSACRHSVCIHFHQHPESVAA